MTATERSRRYRDKLQQLGIKPQGKLTLLAHIRRLEKQLAERDQLIAALRKRLRKPKARWGLRLEKIVRK